MNGGHLRREGTAVLTSWVHNMHRDAIRTTQMRAHMSCMPQSRRPCVRHSQAVGQRALSVIDLSPQGAAQLYVGLAACQSLPDLILPAKTYLLVSAQVMSSTLPAWERVVSCLQVTRADQVSERSAVFARPNRTIAGRYRRVMCNRSGQSCAVSHHAWLTPTAYLPDRLVQQSSVHPLTCQVDPTIYPAD